MDEESGPQAVHGGKRKHISKLSIDAHNKVNQLRHYQIVEKDLNEEAKFKSEDEIIRESNRADTKKLSRRKHRLHFSSSFAELTKLS